MRKRKKQAPTPAAVFAIEETGNSKLGPVSTTSAAQQSCPTSCVFLGNGCYAEGGWPKLTTTWRLNRNLREYITPEEIAVEEAIAIDGLSGDRDLRLHFVGDSTTEVGTQILAEAACRYMKKNGRRVWTYTHAWRTVPRSAWGSISVLASCETEEEVIAARRLGYATILVVPKHHSRKLQRGEAINLLPCPWETHGANCAKCRLCMDDRRLRESNITIAFEAHGDERTRNKAL